MKRSAMIIDNTAASQNPDDFKLNELENYVKKFSFPRRIGTPGEKIARKMTFLEFKKMGFTPHREHFVCSLFYSINLLRIVLLTLISMVFFMEWVSFIAPAYNMIVLFVYICWALYLLRMSQKPHKINWGKNYLSSNIFVFIPAKSYGMIGNVKIFGKFGEDYKDDLQEEDEVNFHDDYEDGADPYGYLEYGWLPTTEEQKYGNIIISAHTDSKSQSITTITRVRLFKRSFKLFSVLLILFIFGGIMDFIGVDWIHPFLNIITTCMSIIVILFTIILFLNRSLNNSPGALDNASGMACVFALAKYFKDKPLDRFNLYFMQFGVEEFGQQGARKFVLNRLNQFKRKRTFNFNLDMVGETNDTNVPILESIGFKRRQVDPLMQKFIEESTNELGIKLNRLNLPIGAHTDRMAFTKYGFNGIDFASQNAGKWAHSPKDTPDKVNPKILQDVCRIIEKTVKKMDDALKNNMFPEPKDAKHINQAYY